MEGRSKHESSSSTRSSSNAVSSSNNSAAVPNASPANVGSALLAAATSMPPPITQAVSTSSTPAPPASPALLPAAVLLPVAAAAAAAAGPQSSSGGATASTSSGATSSSSSKGISHRPAVFDKLEQLVRDMQDVEHGVPVRSQKLFITTIPAAFMGYDLIEWLMDRLSIEDSLEAVHLANLLCQFGYYFPIQELKNLIVKDDSSLYRFQTPYYWPSQHHTPDNIEYAIYLAKRSQRNKQKHGLEDYEVEAYNNLKKILTSKWDFVSMQADEQLKLNKDRKKGDKIVTDSQEKAYWRVYRPPPGFTTVVESSPVPTREQRIKARSRTREHLTEELEFLRNYALMVRAKISQVAESVIEYTEDFYEFDAVLNPNSVGPSNPWITDDQAYWILNQPLVDCPTEKRVRRWSISLENLISDQQGVLELMAYLKREYSHENLRFWLAVQELRTGPGSEAKIKKKVKEIWDEFLSPGAKAEINIDGKTMEATKVAIKSPTRYTYEVAAEHVYTLLLKKDCYPRFIRSDHYKALSANSVNPGNQKKRFPFTFVGKKKGSSAQNPTGGGGMSQGGQVVTNPKAALEGCNIYGADGTEDIPTDSAAGGTNSDSRLLSCDLDDSICPWDTGPAEEATGTTMGESSRQHHRELSPRQDLTAATGGIYTLQQQQQARAGREAAAAGGNGGSGGLTRESSRSSRRSGGGGAEGSASGGHHHRHHDHHHHHEHHHSASKRAKSKSKRKKSTRSKGPSSSAAADKENISTTAEMLAAGTAAVMSTAATTAVASSAAVAVAAAAAAAAAATTGGNSIPPPSSESGATADGDERIPLVPSQNEEEMSEMGATSSKCTQTKLEQLLLLERTAAAAAAEIPGGGGNHQTEIGEWTAAAAEEAAGDNPGAAVAAAAAGATEGGDAEAKKELGAAAKTNWAGSSTEVCPWEDDSSSSQSSSSSRDSGETTQYIRENRKDSHAPFVKTYATLGYL